MSSDADTPPVSSWPTADEWRPQASGLPRLSVSYYGSGDICAADGVVVGVTATGFTPISSAQIQFTPPSEPNYNLFMQGVSIDPNGDLA